MTKLQILLILILIVFGSSSSAQTKIWFKKGEHLCKARNINEKLVFNAVDLNSEALLYKFLKNGGNPNATDDCGIAVIFYAVRLVQLDSIKMLVKAGANVNTIDSFYGKPPLLWLIESGSSDTESADVYESAKFLLENGANVNLKTEWADSALMAAVEKRNQRLVELLIAFGATINYQTEDGITAYSYAAQTGDKKLKEILIKAGADIKIGVQEYRKNYGENAFFQAAADGRTDVVEAMIASGTDVNLANSGGKMTALMRATEESTVDSLLAAGADVNLKDNSGHTALLWAILFRQTKIVEKLISAGADVKARNNKGESALDLALDDKIKAVLLKNGAK